MHKDRLCDSSNKFYVLIYCGAVCAAEGDVTGEYIVREKNKKIRKRLS